MSTLTSRIDSLVLGETPDGFQLEAMDDSRIAAAALAAQARRTLDIFTPDLEPAIYDTEAFIEGVTRLALQHRRARVRILLRTPSTAVARGHRLIERARRLSSTVEIRRPHPDDADRAEAVLIADRVGVLHRRFAERYEGTVSFHAPAHARDLTASFDGMWEHGQPEIEIKRLHL